MSERRRFNTSERVAFFLAQGGKCANCGKRLHPGWHADHMQPWSKGGKTLVINGQALCPSCNQIKGDTFNMQEKMTDWERKQYILQWGLPLKPRPFQLKSLRKLRKRIEDLFEEQKHDPQKRDVFAVITTGGGKTLLAIALFLRLRQMGIVKRLVVVCHSDAVKKGWIENGYINLRNVKNRDGAKEPEDKDGCVITYQSVSNFPDLQDQACIDEDTMVVFDEVHHVGDTRDWGKQIQRAFAHAIVRLGMTATPWRRPEKGLIPGARYNEETGLLKADTEFSFSAGIIEGCTRPIQLFAYDASMHFVHLDGYKPPKELSFSDNEEGEDSKEDKEILDKILKPESTWFRLMVQKSWAHLKVYMTGSDGNLRVPDAKLLIVVENQKYAKRAVKLVRELTEEDPIVIVSEDGEVATRSLDEFKYDPTKHIAIVVDMVSEGVNIPAIYGVMYATRKRTPLKIVQVAGRPLRRRGEEDTREAFMYGPGVPRLLVGFKALSDESKIAKMALMAYKAAQMIKNAPLEEDISDNERRHADDVIDQMNDWDNGGRHRWEDDYILQEPNESEYDDHAWMMELALERYEAWQAEHPEEQDTELGYVIASEAGIDVKRVITQGNTIEEYSPEEYKRAEAFCMQYGYALTNIKNTMDMLRDNPVAFPMNGNMNGASADTQKRTYHMTPDDLSSLLRTQLHQEVWERACKINADDDTRGDTCAWINASLEKRYKKQRPQYTDEQFRDAIRWVKTASTREVLGGKDSKWIPSSTLEYEQV